MAPDPTAPPEDGTIVDRVLHTAARYGATVAVRDSEGELTYTELAERVLALATRLRARGVGPADLVGVAASRSRHTVVALLGVMAAGAAYVPLEPSLPHQRLQEIVSVAEPVLAIVPVAADPLPELGLTVLADDGPLPGRSGAAPVSPQSDSSALAYVIFTSGSTGTPKGVCVPHSAVLNLLDHMADEPGLAAGERMLGVTTPAFDLSVPDLFLPLLVGATLVLAARVDCVDGAALVALLEREQPDLMQATPSTWRLLLAAGWPGLPALRIVCGGESYEAGLARSLAQRSSGVWNFYGPTETAVWSVAQLLPPDVLDPIPMGFAVRNTVVEVLGPDGSAAPAGEPGELVIGGAGVARGYLNRPDLTAAAFVQRLEGIAFRTGDYVRRDAAGRLTFLERRDGQVKIRGYRVELGDVEAALRSVAGVAQAVAVVVGASPARIVAFVCGAVAAPQVRAELAERLPAYMVPGQVRVVDALPMTANGKVDRRALTELAKSVAPAAPAGVAAAPSRPATPLEQSVAAMWREVLDIDTPIGPDDDFFALGGDSLAAVRIMARSVAEFGASPDVETLFAHPSVAGFALSLLAAALDDLSRDEADRLLPVQPGAGAA